MACFADDSDDVHVPIAQMMSTALVVVDAEATVSAAAASMRARGVGCVIVPDARTAGPAGVFTERDLMARVVGAGLDPQTTRVGDVMTRDVVVLDADTPALEAAEVVNRYGFRHVPIVAGGRLVGIVSLRDLFRLRLRWVEAHRDAELRTLRETQALLAMDEASRVRSLLEVNRRLTELALTDELTGLFNHRYFLRRLKEEVARAQRLHTPLALLFADIDLFKQVNDAHGHPEGDHVLQQVAQTLRETVEGPNVVVRLRASDVVVRYGGEEFAVLLMDARTAGAACVAERMRAAIADTSISLRDGTSVHVTVSFGVAALPEHATDAEALVGAADQALYRAKDRGRNRVEVAA